jgi:hypothetical protein
MKEYNYRRVRVKAIDRKEKERHVTRLGPDMTGLVTRLVTRPASDVDLRGNPLLQGPLSARPAAPEPIPHPQVQAARGVVCVGVAKEGREVEGQYVTALFVYMGSSLSKMILCAQSSGDAGKVQSCAVLQRPA